MEVLPRQGRHQLGAEELLELGRPVPMYRYAHTPFLAGRRELGRAQVPLVGNLLEAPRNLLVPAMGQIAVPTSTSTLTKALIVGIPVAIVLAVFSLT